MKKIIGGLLSCLMLCGLLVGCSGNNTSSVVSTVTAPYEKGTVTETEFTSTWMGLKYTLQDDMRMMPEEYLESQSISGRVQMEMQALRDNDSGDNIVMLTENLSSLPSMDENKYLEMSKPQLENLAKNITFDEVGQRTVAGETFYALPYHLTMEANGVSLEMDQTLLCKKMGDRMICITISHSKEDSIDYLLAGFSKI